MMCLSVCDTIPMRPATSVSGRMIVATALKFFITRFAEFEASATSMDTFAKYVLCNEIKRSDACKIQYYQKTNRSIIILVGH